MESNYSLIEDNFSDCLIKLVGPTSEQNEFREIRLKIVRSILEKTFNEQGIQAHIFSFGSFPIRTYLPDSDMDVTIVIEDLSTNGVNILVYFLYFT